MKKIFALLVFSVVTFMSVSAQRTITGTLLDEEGLGLIGANVLVKGTTIGTISDFDGSYSLEVPSGSETLVFSYTGYNSVEETIGDRNVINLTMTQNTKLLDEVVIVGYTEGSRLGAVSSLASISSDAVENRPNPNVVSSVQGQIPGFVTSANSGQPGSTQQVRIRGTGSISAGRNPLYVIDGVIIQTGSFSQLDAGSNSTDVLSMLNPNDIESVNVLKDASATALYGSRGSNGVIVINTKRGKAGKTAVTLKTQYGTSEATFGKFKLMNAQQQFDHDRTILANSGLDEAEIANQRPTSLLDNTFDWLDAAFRQGTNYNVEVQARGGNEKTKFFVSGGYSETEGTQIFSDYQRTSLRTNLDHTATERLSFGLDMNVSYSQQSNAVNGNRFQSPLLSSFSTTPLQGAVNPATGELYVGNEQEYIGFTGDNFLYSLPRNSVNVNTFRLLSTMNLAYKINDNLRFTQKTNIDFINDDSSDFDDPTTNDGRDDNGGLTSSFNQSRAITSQSFLRFTTDLGGGDHSISGLGGFEYQRVNTKQFFASGIGFADGRLQTLNSSSEPQSVGGSISNYAFVSFLGHVNYDFQSKYLVTVSFRRDGSSRFGKNNQWGNFGSIGAAWLVSEEDFFPENDILSNLKVKASFGTAGNAAIGNFPSLELYGFGNSYQGNPGSSPSQISNPDLTWESSKQFNIGLDFGLFNNRITGLVEYYKKTASDLLLQVPVSRVSGFTQALRNIGEIQNSGVELSLKADIINSEEFNWNVNFNIGFNRDEITSLPDGEDIDNGSQIWRVGEPIRSFSIRSWAGVNPADGTPLWHTTDDEGNINGITGVYNDADELIVGNATPDFTAGLRNQFSYKGIYLDAFFYTAQGHELYNASKPFIDSDGSRFGWVQIVEAADHWRQPGDISERPLPLTGGNNNSNNTSTRYLEDASFIRLKTLTLGYTLPRSISENLKISNANFYLTANNLWTQTKYSGIDPEADEDGSEFFRYPVGKSLSFGLDVTF
ncbi:MAG: TonB-dependent receptor [Saprospiraceae bacterium]|nr:TonB-dependent receptor [Saprospiraceae bacterium]